jgi:4-alpha-glucanotransferase
VIEPDPAGALRAAGLLLPLFSMPSSRSWGIGEFPDLAALARWMQGAGLRVLQLLPANEMATGQRSPYSALSAMALDPIFIAVEDVEDFQALGRDALDGAMRGLRDHAQVSRAVDYRPVRALKDRALRASFRRFLEQEWPRDTGRARSLKRFIEDEAWWLEDYALFRAAHQATGGRSWHDWPDEIRDHRRGALDRMRREHGRDILFRQYLQWIAQSQWQQTREAARACGVALYGDLPFGVAADSADVWANQELFSFDGSAGAPPDAFSDEGQNWALPVYRWDVLQETGYAWFAARGRRAADLFDGFRVDHVVGLFRTWTFDRNGKPACFIPAEEPAQIAQGVAVLQALGGRAAVLAEDLGTIPGFVRKALADLAIPGYKVLRWERHWEDPRQPFVDPVTYPALSLATSGTHDTETLAAWWADLGAEDRELLLEVVAALAGPSVAATDPATDPATDQATAQVIDPEGPFTPALRDALIAALYASGSSLLTLPVQDLFGWTDRINVPGLVDERNWTWKLPWPVDGLDDVPEARERQATLRGWAERYGRLP